MSVSPIGASSVSALVLSRLLGNSDSSSSTESASGLSQSGLDSLFISPEAQWMSRTQSGNPFKADLDSLGSLIQSGDMDSAKTAYAAMLEKMQSHQGGQDAVSTEFAAPAANVQQQPERLRSFGSGCPAAFELLELPGAECTADG
ncbi:MAG: hypothetical protein H6Q00_3574 [Holophagaceae bacterium]|nr:hypothetical protein [Holophagaceae bacterium]